MSYPDTEGLGKYDDVYACVCVCVCVNMMCVCVFVCMKVYVWVCERDVYLCMCVRTWYVRVCLCACERDVYVGMCVWDMMRMRVCVNVMCMSVYVFEIVYMYLTTFLIERLINCF